MKKLLAAGVVGLILVASQAAAGPSTGVIKAGDRIGSTGGASNEFLEDTPAPLIILATVVLVAVAATALSDDDSPSSP